MIQAVTTKSSYKIKEELYDQEARIKKLVNHARLLEARELAGVVVKQGIQFGVYDVVCTCYTAMMKYYHLSEPSQYWYRDYKEKREKYKRLLKEEEDVRDFYNNLNHSFDRNRTITDDIRATSTKYIDIIKEYESGRDHGPFFYYKYYYTLCMHHDIHGNQENRLITAEAGYTYFSNYEDVDFSGGEYAFLNVIVDSLISLGRWSECDKYMAIKEEIGSPNEIMRANDAILRARISLYHGDKFIETVPKEPQLRVQYCMMKILRMYSKALGGVLIDCREFKDLGDLRTDPTGMGLSLTIVRLIDAYNKESAIDLSDAMKAYKKAYLKEDPRGKAMIDMLVKSEFGELPGNFDANIEIIPYELIIERLTVPVHQ